MDDLLKNEGRKLVDAISMSMTKESANVGKFERDADAYVGKVKRFLNGQARLREQAARKRAAARVRGAAPAGSVPNRQRKFNEGRKASVKNMARAYDARVAATRK